MYELEPEEPQIGASRFRDNKPGFFESWWALIVVSFASGTLVAFTVGAYLSANFPDFPRMLITLPICGAFGLIFGRFWGRNRIAKRKQREAAKLESGRISRECQQTSSSLLRARS